jgi:20S proteasome subunit beta 6
VANLQHGQVRHRISRLPDGHEGAAEAAGHNTTAYLTLIFLHCCLLYSTDKCVIASAGCQVDMKALQKLLQARNVMFQHNHGKPMSCKGAAQLLSNTLYYKRFFPYYTFNLCAGLDEQGEW